MKSWRVIITAAVIAGIVPSFLMGGEPASQESVGTKDVPKAEYVEFVKSWNKICESGTLDDFVALMNSANGKAKVRNWKWIWDGEASNKTFYIGHSDLFHVFAWKKAEPWVTVIDYVSKDYPTIPGGFVNIGMYEAFTIPASAVSASIPAPKLQDFKTTPSWQYTAVLGGMGLKRGGGTGSISLVDREKGIAAIVIVPRFWVRVPSNKAVGDVRLTLEATADGPHGTSEYVKTPVKESILLKVAQPPTPSREQLLAIWACALEIGEQLNDAKLEDKTKPEYGVLALLNAVLAKESKKSNSPSGHMALQLVGHPLYVKDVAGHLGAPKRK